MIESPRSFGRYEVRDLIGEGSMGRVYRCYDPLSQRNVAVKTLRPELLTPEVKDEHLQRFRREARAAGTLAHAHIVTVFDVGDDFFVMELLEGRTLQTVLLERGRFEPQELLELLRPVADALDFAHSKGIVHRDVKPANVMLAEGRPKLMDFGVAHISSTVMTAAGQFLGSPSYMAPEQISNSEASPRTDLFSFAVLAYELVTGARPFEGDSITAIIYRVVNEEAKPPCSRLPGLPPEYDAIFARALAKNPAARFESAAAFLRAIETRDASSSSAPHLIETHDLRPPAASPSAGTLGALAVAAVLVIAMVAPMVLRQASVPPTPVPAAVAPKAAIPVAAGLSIETTPPGAAVALNGRARGVSPLHLRGLKPGLHAVRVTREGFAPTELSLELQAGPPVPLRLSLQALPRLLGNVAAGAPAASAPDPLAVGPGTKPPERISGEPASYPEGARALKLQGTVIVEMIVDEAGIPEDVRVVKSAGALLDQAVTENVKRFRYKAARRGGRPVRVRQEYKQSFEIH